MRPNDDDNPRHHQVPKRVPWFAYEDASDDWWRGITELEAENYIGV